MARDRKRREWSGHYLREFCDTERTADRRNLWKRCLIGKERSVSKAKSANDDSISVLKSV